MPDMDMVRRFAGCDDDADSAVLEACVNAAEAWYEAAGVPKPSAPDPLYDFWLANLAAWMYDMRGAGGDSTTVPPYFVTSVHQLRPIKAREAGA